MGVIWSMIPLPLKIGASLALLAFLAIGAAWLDHNGYARGYERMRVECVAEQQRIEKANTDAANKAAGRLMKRADELSLKSLELDHALDENDKAAAADPGADGCGVGADSLRRLNTIR